MALASPTDATVVSRDAPGRLELVRAFINTVDVMGETEQLRDTRALRAWLTRNGLLDRRVALEPGDLERALEVREALRDVLEGRAHQGSIVGPVRHLNAIAAGALMRVDFDRHGDPELVSASDGLDGALASLFGIIHAAALEGTWVRLKVCAAKDCRWAYYDRSKNRSGTWCNMAECGNRAKGRSYRERRRAPSR